MDVTPCTVVEINRFFGEICSLYRFSILKLAAAG
jgi:hypothetical protein